MVKLPVGDEESGASSGQTDFAVDGIVSAYGPAVEVSGYGGVIVRGSPDGYELTNGFRWGVGAGFPQRYNLGFRFSAELFGEKYFDDTITAPAGLTATDGSIAPLTTQVQGPVVGALGLTWSAPNGFFVGGAASWNFAMDSRDEAGIGCPIDPKGRQGFRGPYRLPSGRSRQTAAAGRRRAACCARHPSARRRRRWPRTGLRP